jgi:Transposase C of IS166 homeodomain
MMFGTKSEKIAREVEQLELKLEELETGQAERAPASPAGSSTAREAKRSVALCPSICRAKPTPICLWKEPAQRAAVSAS